MSVEVKDAKLDTSEGTTGASLQKDEIWEDKSHSYRQEGLQETNNCYLLYAYLHVDLHFWSVNL